MGGGRASGALRALAIAAAPLAALALVRWGGARGLAWPALGALALGAALRARAAAPGERLSACAPFVPAALLAALTALADDERYLLTTPALVSATVLVAFATSLRPGQVPMIERFARVAGERLTPGADLAPATVRHCRRFTRAWTVFLALNTAVAAALAWHSPIAWWAAYTGGVAYVFMGALFVAERVARARLARTAPLAVPRAAESAGAVEP